MEVSDDRDEAIEYMAAAEEEHNKSINVYQENIDNLQKEVKSLRKDELEMINKQQFREQVQQGIKKLEKISKLWSDKDLTWKEKKCIEKEISQDSLPFSTFIAIVSIERYLRTMPGIDDDSQAKKIKYIMGANLDRRHEERVWKAFHVRDK